jgi:homoserine O-acetyltransferase/O-succinyltransferase
VHGTVGDPDLSAKWTWTDMIHDHQLEAPLAGHDLPASGAWVPDDPVGNRQFVNVTANRPFTLEGGGTLAGVTMAYETWGTLNADASNAVLVCHALTGDSHAAGKAGPGHRTPGWWDDIIGPGLVINTDHWFVVCVNVLGGCQGSTGPSSVDPGTGTRYGPRFGVVTVRDIVRAQRVVADHLGVGTWASVVGGSMGGMTALEWAVMFPDRVRSLATLASCAASSALQIAWSAVQRRAIAFDPAWAAGDYYDAADGAGPHRGLGLAREMAQITYRTGDVLGTRFGRAAVDPMDDGLAMWQRFDVEGYLDHHASKLARRFDANSYLVLTKAMDLHDVSRGRGGTAAALARVRARCLVATIDSDSLYPPAEQRQLAEGLAAGGATVDQVTIHSPHGHDGFLLEPEQVGAALSRLLEEVGNDD